MRLPSGRPADFDFRHDLPAGPFHHSLDVGWGDTDSAQIAYTANIPAWGLKAIEAWFRACLGGGWYEMNFDFGVGTPFVDLSCSFHAPITPRQPLDLEVTVERIGGASLAYLVEGRQAASGAGPRHCFTGRYVNVFSDAVAMKPLPIPAAMRANIVRFAERQGRPYEDRLPHATAVALDTPDA